MSFEAESTSDSDPHTEAPSSGFAYAGITVRVTASEAGYLAWLREFLTPSFEIVGGAEADFALSLRVDARLFDAFRDRGPASGRAIAFVLDDSVVDLPLWREAAGDGGAGNRRIVHDETFGVFYIVEGREVTLLAREHGPRLRSPLMRVVREYAMNHARTGRAFFLHASAFVVDDCVYLVGGPRRAGKTTLLFHALQEPRVRYLANDRVLVTFDEDGLLLRGMPSILSVRPGTLELFPDLHRRLKERRDHFRSTLAEAARAEGPEPRPWSDGRLGLSPAQACGVTGSEAVATARRAVLLFPRIREGSVPVDLQALSVETATERVEAALYASAHPNARSELFGPGASVEESEEERRARCRDLAARLDGFDCFLAGHAYEGDLAARRFIDRLVALQPAPSQRAVRGE